MPPTPGKTERNTDSETTWMCKVDRHNLKKCGFCLESYCRSTVAASQTRLCFITGTKHTFYPIHSFVQEHNKNKNSANICTYSVSTASANHRTGVKQSSFMVSIKKNCRTASYKAVF